MGIMFPHSLLTISKLAAFKIYGHLSCALPGWSAEPLPDRNLATLKAGQPSVRVLAPASKPAVQSPRGQGAFHPRFSRPLLP